MYATGKYRLKSAQEYAVETNTPVPVLRKYLRYSKLDDVIMKCPLPNKIRLSEEQKVSLLSLYLFPSLFIYLSFILSFIHANILPYLYP